MDKNRLFKELYSVPINVYDEPYFSSRVDLFGFSDKYSQFLKDVECVGFEKYKDSVESTICSGIKKVKSLQNYKFFMSAMYKSHLKDIKFVKNGGNFYNLSNVDKEYLCIDLYDIAFESVKEFLGTSSLAEFLSDICTIESIVNSKKVQDDILYSITQIGYTPIFVLVNDIISALYKSDIISKSSIIFFANVHRIIISDWNKSFDVNEVMSRFNVSYVVYVATLNSINETGFILKYDDNVELYNVDLSLFPMLIRQAKGEKLRDEDLVFKSSSGYLAKFLEVVKYEI